MKKIPHNKPSLGNEESIAASKVIESGWIAQGHKVGELENNICEFLNIDNGHSLVVSSGTSALFISLKIFDFPIGSEVLIPSYVCSALLNAIYLANLTPVIIDVNAIDFNFEVSEITSRLSAKTKAVIIPHMYGIPVDMSGFEKLKRDGIIIIEDCATALGSYDSNIHVGMFGDISIFSFYASKFITCGNGGGIFSKNKVLIEKARDYREFDCTANYKPRFNFQLTDVQAAVGIVQFSKVNVFLKKRKIFSDAYSTLCLEKGIEYQKPLKPHLRPNNYRFVLKSNADDTVKLQNFLRKRDIETIIPIESYELLHNYMNLNKSNFQISESIATTTLSLPIYPALKDTEFNYILETLKAF